MAKEKVIPTTPEAVIEYLRSKNRPYSATDVALNMGQSKTLVQKILTQLASNGAIHGKSYGKQQVYVIKQDDLETPTPEELATVDGKIEKLDMDLKQLRQENKVIHSQVITIGSTPTTKEALEMIEKLMIQNQSDEAKLIQLRSGTKLIPVEERKIVDAHLSLYVKEWIKRQRLFRNAWERILEAMDAVKPSELMDEIGIDRDEDAGVNLAEIREKWGF